MLLLSIHRQNSIPRISKPRDFEFIAMGGTTMKKLCRFLGASLFIIIDGKFPIERKFRKKGSLSFTKFQKVSVNRVKSKTVLSVLDLAFQYKTKL